MKHPVLTSVANSLTSRRGARLWLLGALAIILAVFGLLSSMPAAERSTSTLVDGSDSAKVEKLLEEIPDSGKESALLVAGHPDQHTLDTNDLKSLESISEKLSTELPLEISKPLLSEDGQLSLLTASWDSSGTDGDRQLVTDLREQISVGNNTGFLIEVSGAPAFGLDLSATFAGADFTLLAVTVGIVAVLLILTYRSPILWLIPLIVVALADRSASLIANALSQPLDLHFDSGVLSVLVFGAGTNYALLLISRYRDELQQHSDHRAALASAWRNSFEAIVSSNLTVVLALATLALAVMEDTRGLGIACAAGLLIAAAFNLFLLTPLMALCGRKVFWPLVPRPDQVVAKRSLWGKAAAAVIKRPIVNLSALVLILVVLASALGATNVGLRQTEQFRSATESTSATERIAEHFPIGETAPITVLAKPGTGEAVTETAENVPGVERANLLPALPHSALERVMVIGSSESGSPESFELIESLRSELKQVPGAEPLVGGTIAEAYDAHQSHLRDFAVIAPLIVAVCLVMLWVVTGKFRTALVLSLTNLLSAAAAVGLGSLIGSMLFDTAALDVQVPLLAFVFLVALGVDYTIFLTQRVKQESKQMPLDAAIVNATSRTGAVITSAGVVLAGVFAALSSLPLMVLGQLGLIVGLGVLLDTFVVRTLLLPALFILLGRAKSPVFGYRGPRITPENSSTVELIESKTHA
ncbi:MMPL family transporter [Glutamicibacter arilaitensis]|uniref:MMPL family transporter n=1 Tax=Glutamicibacter arilaitensis TaxID=256701 RepID=UPI003850E3B2